MNRKNVLRLLASVCLLLSSALAKADADLAYDEALQLIEQRDYPVALAQLRQLQRNYPGFEKLVAVQTRIAVLSESVDAGESLPTFLQALNLRDDGQVVEAIALLDEIAQAYPAGTLTDDALYIMAYLRVMDRYEFAEAQSALQTLNRRFPDSAYTDSAQYLQAIAMEQVGDTQGARDALIQLRERHTALSLPMDFRWPTGTVLSRYWFDRADRRLAIVTERLAQASRVRSQERVHDGLMRLSVNVAGTDMQLLLVPSPLTKDTRWLDAGLRSQTPPSVGVFDGTVEGIQDSWVRAVLSEGSLTGVVNLNGVQQRLTPANLVGTLEYYQPRAKKGTLPGSQHSELADQLQNLDVLEAPPLGAAQRFSARSREVQTDVRSVPISIVVDSQYDRYFGGAGLANALSSLNVADGIYRQFGLALELDEAVQFQDAADPMSIGAASLETILRTFRDYRLRYKTLFEGSALSYLFSGNPKTDVTLGLAWIDTACRTDGYDVGVTTPTDFGDVLLTHELGHSLGAHHDSDTRCSNNQDAIMWPNISERTTTSFTSCSRERVIASRSKACLNNSVDLSLAAHRSGAQISFTVANPDNTLTLDARLVIETSAPEQLIWPDDCQVITPTSAQCLVAALLPSESRRIGFSVSERFKDQSAPVTGQVSPVGVLELQDANNVATVSLDGNLLSSHLPVNDAYENAESASEPPSTGAAKAAGFVDSILLWMLGLLAAVRIRFYMRS